MKVNALLPHALDVGEVRRWFLPLPPTGAASRDEPDHLVLIARFLGMGSSYVEAHTDHVSRFVDRGVRCNACRWFEVRIFRELLVDDLDEVGRRVDDVPPGDYVVHTTGASVVTGEQPLYRYETLTSPHGVVEALTTRRISDNGPEAFITKPSARALAEAAGHDRDMARAYVDRGVA